MLPVGGSFLSDFKVSLNFSFFFILYTLSTVLTCLKPIHLLIDSPKPNLYFLSLFISDLFNIWKKFCVWEFSYIWRTKVIKYQTTVDFLSKLALLILNYFSSIKSWMRMHQDIDCCTECIVHSLYIPIFLSLSGWRGRRDKFLK